MTQIRNRVIVALASSAVLASGLSVAVTAVAAVSSAPVSVADASTSAANPTPNVSIVDP